jgi:uncharacterized protein YndB with AHSA1/START domain
MTDASIVSESVRINAAPSIVFEYFVQPELLLQWMGTWADLQAEPDGLYAVDFPGVPVRGRFVEVDPPRRLVFTWGIPGNDALPAGSSTVEVQFTADGGGTLVELTHRDLPAERVADHAAGWRDLLKHLAAAS